MNVESGFQIGDLARIARRRSAPAAAIGGAVFLVSIVLAAVIPNTYEAYVTLLVEPQSISKRLVEAGLEESDLNNRLHLMTMEILSRGRLSKIINELDLYPEESKELTREEVISMMRSHIVVEPVLPELDVSDRLAGRAQEFEINTFRLYYRSRSAPKAAEVANRLANDFIEEHIKGRVQVSGDTSEFISNELSRLSERITGVEERIAEVKNANAGRLPEDMVSNQRRLERTLESLREARQAHALAESDRAFYAQQAIAAAASNKGEEDVSPERRLDSLRLMIDEYRARGLTEKHPDVRMAEAEIETIEARLAERGDEPEEHESGNFAEQNARAEEERAGLRVASAQADIDRLTAEANEIQEQIALTPKVEEQLSSLQREYEHLFRSFQEYSQKGLQAGVAADMERRQKGEQFRILEAAFPPPAPKWPNRVLIVVVGLMLGAAAGGGAAILLEGLDDSFHDARTLRGALHARVLAEIPAVVLASDLARQRRRRLMATVLAAGIAGVTILGAGAGYVAVNGTPGFVKAILEGEDEPGAGLR